MWFLLTVVALVVVVFRWLARIELFLPYLLLLALVVLVLYAKSLLA